MWQVFVFIYKFYYIIRLFEKVDEARFYLHVNLTIETKMKLAR
jgi:hypothetical protein